MYFGGKKGSIIVSFEVSSGSTANGVVRAIQFMVVRRQCDYFLTSFFSLLSLKSASGQPKFKVVLNCGLFFY